MEQERVRTHTNTKSNKRPSSPFPSRVQVKTIN
uniref:Uncharacterized protein n=1 Tax=Anguilla anguilla TaxID=7936 RepID=A0A0E9QZX9_ANGAN